MVVACIHTVTAALSSRVSLSKEDFASEGTDWWWHSCVSVSRMNKSYRPRDEGSRKCEFVRAVEVSISVVADADLSSIAIEPGAIASAKGRFDESIDYHSEQLCWENRRGPPF